MTASLFAAIVERPHIIRIAHMAYYVSDLNKARNYWEDFLGYEEVFCWKNPDGAEHLVFIKINNSSTSRSLLKPRIITGSSGMWPLRPTMPVAWEPSSLQLSNG